MAVLKKSALARAAAWPSSLARRVEFVSEPARVLELPQMPFRQGEEVGRAHLGVVAEPEQRFSVSLTDVVAQCPLKDVSRRLQVAELERDKTENAASHARFRLAPFGFRFPKEGLGGRVSLAMFAAHEALEALRRSRRQSAALRPPVAANWLARA